MVLNWITTLQLGRGRQLSANNCLQTGQSKKHLGNTISVIGLNKLRINQCCLVTQPLLLYDWPFDPLIGTIPWLSWLPISSVHSLKFKVILTNYKEHMQIVWLHSIICIQKSSKVTGPQGPQRHQLLGPYVKWLNRESVDRHTDRQDRAYALYRRRGREKSITNRAISEKMWNFSFFEIEWRKNTLFSLLIRFRVSKKIMRPYVTLLNIFSEIALKWLHAELSLISVQTHK